MVFAGVGMVALPLDLFREFIGRPQATLSHSEYLKRARGLGARANGIKVRGAVCPVTAQHTCIGAGVSADHSMLQGVILKLRAPDYAWQCILL